MILPKCVHLSKNEVCVAHKEKCIIELLAVYLYNYYNHRLIFVSKQSQMFFETIPLHNCDLF